MAAAAPVPRGRRRRQAAGVAAAGVGLSLFRAAIGLGANTGDRAAAIATAIDAFDARDDTRVCERAAPVEYAAEGGPSGQPAFLNTAITVETALPPLSLLRACRRIEHDAGRRRIDPWGPRPIDCDLLLHEDAVVDGFVLQVPHPRLAGRRFVLEPLATIAPDWIDPRSGRTIAELLAEWRARTSAARGAPAQLAGIPALRAWRAGVSGPVGFVPTMGALHAGHRALIRAARAECDVVVVSVYVNPTQFGPAEDFAAYPRDAEADLAACAAEGADAMVVFRDEEMYPAGHDTRVVVGAPAQPLEGAHRPGHFDGVATIVTKLFHLVQPGRAYFGQKDAQQCAVVRRLTRDLDLPLRIEVLPTVRDADGLALSSRNAYLTADERAAALAIPAALRATAAAAADGERDGDALRAVLRGALHDAAGLTLDYAELADPESFAPVERVGDAAVAAVAARVGSTRLIDNLVCWPPPEPGT